MRSRRTRLTTLRTSHRHSVPSFIVELISALEPERCFRLFTREGEGTGRDGREGGGNFSFLFVVNSAGFLARRQTAKQPNSLLCIWKFGKRIPRSQTFDSSAPATRRSRQRFTSGKKEGACRSMRRTLVGPRPGRDHPQSEEIMYLYFPLRTW
jgi:hypothetical protein